MHIQPCGGSTFTQHAKLGKALRADNERDANSESIKPTNDRVEKTIISCVMSGSEGESNKENGHG